MFLDTFKRMVLVKIQNRGSYLLWEDLWLGSQVKYALISFPLQKLKE